MFKCLKICAFNVQNFGIKKMTRPNVPEILSHIFNRYDISLIQEIQDNTNTAIHDLHKRLNNKYGIILSERLGRTQNKEQYGFFYDRTKVMPIARYQYQDVNDWFERPPFSLEFQLLPPQRPYRFIFTACHVKPRDAVSEIDKLVEVHDYLYQHNKNILLMGDFNAGCNYVKEEQFSKIRLRTRHEYIWNINDDTRTTVTRGKCCPYDRFVCNSKSDISKYIDKEGTIYRFDKTFGLTNKQSLNVSDHYPIEININFP